jgi:hypothetical protein
VGKDWRPDASTLIWHHREEAQYSPGSPRTPHLPPDATDEDLRRFALDVTFEDIEKVRGGTRGGISA